MKDTQQEGIRILLDLYSKELLMSEITELLTFALAFHTLEKFKNVKAEIIKLAQK